MNKHLTLATGCAMMAYLDAKQRQLKRMKRLNKKRRNHTNNR